jgi:hypothetical protein
MIRYREWKFQVVESWIQWRSFKWDAIGDKYDKSVWMREDTTIILSQHLSKGAAGNNKTFKNQKILIDIAIIYYITEFTHPEISIFRNTAVTNIRIYQTYVIQVCIVGQ